MIALLLLATTAAAAPNAEELGRELAAAARRGGAAAVSVAAPESPSSAPRDAADEARDELLRGIVESGAVRALERGELPAVMSERRLAASGASTGATAGRLAAADAVVVGALRRAAGGWELSARVVSADGSVLGGGTAPLTLPSEAGSARDEDTFPPLGELVDRAHALAAESDPAALERAASDGALGAAPRAEAVLALADADAAEDLSLADALRDREPLVRLAAEMSLGRRPRSWAEGPLRRVLRADPSWLARFGAAQALARFPSDAAARDLAKVRASDPSWRVRRQAAVSLAEIGRSEEPASPATIE